jgi:hypothetical protein
MRRCREESHGHNSPHFGHVTLRRKLSRKLTLGDDTESHGQKPRGAESRDRCVTRRAAILMTSYTFRLMLSDT